MDRKALFQKFQKPFQKGKKFVLWGLVLSLVLWGGARFSRSHAFKEFKEQYVHAPKGVEAVRLAVVHVQEKVEELKEADSENQRLRVENLNLRRWVEQIRFDCRSENAAKKTHEIGAKLEEQTGSKVGRVLASIDYRPPTHLLPEQVLSLGVSYFKGREHEKAAVIFTYLTGMEDGGESFKTPENYLLAGVSWYRLEHLVLADQYFDKVLALKSSPETLSYFAQARLWKAMVAHRTGQHAGSQKWLRDLLDYHPHSLEAAWVNGMERARAPASVEEVEEPSHEEIKPEGEGKPSAVSQPHEAAPEAGEHATPNEQGGSDEHHHH